MIPTQCQNIAEAIDSILQLLKKHKELKKIDPSGVQLALRKALSPRFEIVFAGAFSAGKSMLINALLGRELLYSAEGHATGTECYIEYAPADQERVVLTFLSLEEILEQVRALCQLLQLNVREISLKETSMLEGIKNNCRQIIEAEGGVNKSERAKQANALLLLLEGVEENKDKIKATENATYSMEQFNFSTLAEAASYARRGRNSAVLKRIDYFCHHPLLEDGNVLVDLPGIDAPVEKDARLSFEKITNPETSLVVCVLKSASAGDLTQRETELLEAIKSNPAIGNRVFYVFNRVDETWYNSDLRKRLDNLIKSEFNHTKRVYKTSGLLGFYGSQVKKYTSAEDRFGLDSIFAEEVKGEDGVEDTPKFVSEFNNYCASSGKLTTTNFRISVNSYETPNQNYVRILNECGMSLIDKLIEDSGVEYFKEEITRYLREEKHPELFKNLADELQNICLAMKRYYQDAQLELESQPKDVQEMKRIELSNIKTQLKKIGDEFSAYFEEKINSYINGENHRFNGRMKQMEYAFVSSLNNLLETFSVTDAYGLALERHPRNQTAPFLAVLVEAFYYLANSLEDVLTKECKSLAYGFVDDLIEDVRRKEFYGELCRLLGNDAGIVDILLSQTKVLCASFESLATAECDRYVRETGYNWEHCVNLGEILKKTSQTYDVSSIVEAQPQIRSLLKQEFEQKVNRTIYSTFPQSVKQNIKKVFIPLSKKISEVILDKYDEYLHEITNNIEEKARKKLERNQKILEELYQDIDVYNQAVTQINKCLESWQIYGYLPLIIKY